MAEDRLARLARNLDAVPAKDQLRIKKAREIEELRREGASQMHALCRDLVKSLNKVLTQLTIEFTPDSYDPDSFDSASANLFQIHASGRILQVAFEAKEAEASTARFRTPYLLEGSVRWYNQDLLDKQEIQEQNIFFVLDKDGPGWRFYDSRKHRAGVFDRDHLIGLLEQLV
jgi:hypothetical protein